MITLETLVEIIGEAATRFDAEFRAAHPEIPWRKMIADAAHPQLRRRFT